MCKNCYHSKGRTKKATKCLHSHKALYAKGMCKNCYISEYIKVKKNNKLIVEKNDRRISNDIISS